MHLQESSFGATGFPRSFLVLEVSLLTETDLREQVTRRASFMTRFELRTMAQHHRSWLRGEREAISADHREANLRGDFGEIMRNLGRPVSSRRSPDSRHSSQAFGRLLNGYSVRSTDSSCSCPGEMVRPSRRPRRPASGRAPTNFLRSCVLSYMRDISGHSIEEGLTNPSQDLSPKQQIGLHFRCLAREHKLSKLAWHLEGIHRALSLSAQSPHST